MYKRYISNGDTAKQAMLFCKVNRLAYSKKLNKHDITSRTNIIQLDSINDETAANMEKMLLFAYFYYIKNNNDFSEAEYKYYKKLIVALGKKKLHDILDNFSSKTGCVGIKEDEDKYRIVYFSK